MLAVLALLLGITLASEEWKSEVNRNFDDLDHYDNFLSWKEAFGKEYDNEQEEQHRFLLFVDNWRMINEHNMESHNYTMGNNQFSDLTQTEFWYEVHGHAESCIRKRDDAIYKQLPGEPQDTISAAAPSSIDWTNVNGSSYVTPVKNQGLFIIISNSSLCLPQLRVAAMYTNYMYTNQP